MGYDGQVLLKAYIYRTSNQDTPKGTHFLIHFSVPNIYQNSFFAEVATFILLFKLHNKPGLMKDY